MPGTAPDIKNTKEHWTVQGLRVQGQVSTIGSGEGLIAGVLGFVSQTFLVPLLSPAAVVGKQP